MRRLVSGTVLLLAVPVLAVVPLDGVQDLVLGNAAASAPMPSPVAPVVRHLEVTPQSGALRPALVQPTEFSRDTDNFRMVSASWDSGALPAGASLQIETRAGGEWSAWSDLDATDMGPDAGSADAKAAAAEGGKAVSDGVWVDHADGIRVRVVGAAQLPSGLELTLIDPGSSAADAHPGAAEQSGAVAHAASTMPQIFTRADWGADESLRSHNPGCGTPQYTSTIKVGFVHHTATSNDYSPDDVPAILRAIYADHVLSNGWCDIGYNFVVDKFGRIWEGRYGGVDQPVLGAHTGGFNTDSFGVSLLGNYETERSGGTEPSSTMLNALENLLAWKLGMYGRDATGTTTLVSAGGPDTRFPRGQTVTFNVISGHRDAGNTLCPGNEVYDRLPQIRRATQIAMLGAALVDPKVLSDFSPNNGDVVVGSGMLLPGTWQLDIKNGAGALVRTLTGSGSSIQADWDRRDSSGRLVPNGPYRLTLSSTQNGIDAVPWSANIVLGRSIGAITQAFGKPGQLIVQGWVLRDGTSDPTSVRVVVDGGFNGTAISDLPRGDVADRYPEWGQFHGYDVTVPAAPGSRHVCVYGVNDGIADTQLECATADVPQPARPATDAAGNPFGSLDAAAVTAPGTVAIRGWAMDLDTRGGIDADAYVDGHPLMRMVADDSRPDVARNFSGMGDRHGYSATLHMAGGTHQICVFGINVGFGSGNPALDCRNVTLPTGPPYGSIDAAAMTSLGKVAVRGWAIDPDTIDPVRVDFYVDGKGAASVHADDDRPDVARIFTLYGAKHGYHTTLSLTGGTHQICAYAINLGPASGNPQIGCRTVTLPTGPPLGSYDVATMTAPGQVLVRGWALDPDSADPVRVDFYLDGKGLTSVHADGNRPDIERLFPLYGAAHGFQATFSLPGGTHQLCAFAINLGPAAGNPLLGCRTVTLPTGSPYGSFDSAVAADAGHVRVRGWAIDPDVAGPVRVDFYIDGKGAASIQADGDRPDIAKAFPPYGAGHGFDTTLNVAKPGKHEVCAYAIGVGGGAPNTQLACLPFTSS